MTSVIEVEFPRGTCPIHTFGSLEDRSAPVVLLFMDAFGPRPATFAVAENLASSGYRVLLPDLFYEHRPYRPLDPQSLFSGGEDRQRLGTLIGTLTQDAVDADISALLAYCQDIRDPGVPMCATGYCMGGRYALTAVTQSSEVVAAATFHASTLAPAEGDSPHRHLDGVKARIYIGVAGIDPSFGAEEEGRLAQALRAAEIDHMIETYAGAAHGFVMSDLPVHNAKAAECHLARLKSLLSVAFR
ncbi:MAG: dienelactone hydrolase family protein [Sphingobium sp.]